MSLRLFNQKQLSILRLLKYHLKQLHYRSKSSHPRIPQLSQWWKKRKPKLTLKSIKKISQFKSTLIRVKLHPYPIMMCLEKQRMRKRLSRLWRLKWTKIFRLPRRYKLKQRRKRKIASRLHRKWRVQKQCRLLPNRLSSRQQWKAQLICDDCNTLIGRKDGFINISLDSYVLLLISYGVLPCSPV